ncbi:hypothetical protein EG348_15025 [Chryseobacterium sp. G0201]|nr:hypothetical protein EG348_15025 [Chryseobacterium sp. G0201]
MTGIIEKTTNTLAPIETTSFFVAACASLRPQQKRYSGKREIASKKIKLQFDVVKLLQKRIFRKNIQ